MEISKISLGSAQWGLNYGISNSRGRTSSKNVKEIIDMGISYGITHIDTANAYGNAEQIIGRNKDCRNKITTKISIKPDFVGGCIEDKIIKEVKRSLKKLRSKSVYGVLLHNTDAILQSNNKGILNGFNLIKEMNLVKKIGISVYEPEEAERVMNQFPIDLIQIPLNVFDQRFLDTKILSRLRTHCIEIHARSIFLQGLLLMKPSKLDKYFSPWRKNLESWSLFCRNTNESPVHVAFNFVNCLSCIDQCVIGFENQSQLKDLINLDQVSYKNMSKLSYEFLSSNKKGLIDPRGWKIEKYQSNHQ